MEVIMGNYIYHDIKKPPFSIYGLYDPCTEEKFRRIPKEVAEATSDGVTVLHTNTAGGRVRFKTDSPSISVKVSSPLDRAQMFHATPLMQFGIDLYNDKLSGSVYVGCSKPAYNIRHGYECEFNLGAGEKELTLNMPLYGDVDSIEIGIIDGATLTAHSKYKHEKPIVFYGSSITQGGCASRPGTSYESIISRKYDCNYINLGFSGNAKAEDAITQYMATLDMAAFVSDYDHNAPSCQYLADTHYKMYETIRKANPTLPYYMISKPDFYFNADCMQRRAIIMESYVKAWNSGDHNVYFIDGSAFFNGSASGDCTVDTCHPTDAGFFKMAEYIGDVLYRTLEL